MPVVSIDLRQLSGTSPGVAPLINRNAEAWFTPYRPYRVEAGSDDYEVSSDTLKVPLVAGIAAPVMPQTPTGQGVWVQIRNARGLGRSDRWLVTIPAGDVNLFDLPHLDPTTLDPDAPLDPAWLAALNTAVPLGGTTGQVLAKASDADHDDVWVDPSGGAVDSVNTKTGVVVLTQDDIGDGTTAKQYSAADKAKVAATSGTNTGDQDLSGLVSKTTTVNGHALSANVTVSKSDVGLGSVDNTSDASKPVSTAQATINAAKADLVGGLVPTSQLPAIALTTGQAVANRAALLALSNVQQGDIGVITGTADKGTYILTTSDPTVFANWLLLNAPTDVVSSVNGQTGTVVLAKGDVGLGNVDNTADTAKPVSTAQALADTAIGTAAATDATTKVGTETTRATTAEALLAPKASPTFTGDPKAPTPTPGDNDTSIATTAFVTAADVVAVAAAATAANLAMPPRYRTYVSGRYYGVEGTYVPGQVSFGDGFFTVVPFWLHASITALTIGGEVVIAAGAGTIRFGIYGSNASDQPSGAAILDAGTVSATTTGVKEITISQAMTPGLYWLGVGAQGGAPTLRTIGNGGQAPVAPVSLNNFGSGATSSNSYYMTGVSGALPTWAGLNDNASGYRVMVKV